MSKVLVGFDELRGKVITRIDHSSDQITFYCSDGTKFEMYHNQDCCESVEVEDICGNLDDLIGYPVLMADESSSEGDCIYKAYDESCTWTFYNISTIKGSVSIRWYGTSNGYYSESVSFYRIDLGVSEVCSNY